MGETGASYVQIMIYPPYARLFPDSKAVDITLGNQQRAMLTELARKPGRGDLEELAVVLGLPGDDATPRRRAGERHQRGARRRHDRRRTPTGWMLQPYTDAPVTISF